MPVLLGIVGVQTQPEFIGLVRDAGGAAPGDVVVMGKQQRRQRQQGVAHNVKVATVQTNPIDITGHGKAKLWSIEQRAFGIAQILDRPIVAGRSKVAVVTIAAFCQLLP